MKALITGITGQDGSYLAELLLEKGYEVHGIIRRSSSFNTGRIDHIFDKLHLYYGDMSDPLSIDNVISEVKPDEIYHLGAQSHVRVSFDVPVYTGQVDALGTLYMLEAVKKHCPQAKFYNASTSELFGNSQPPQSETTPFAPRSPYGCAKLYAYSLVVNYREAYNLFAVNGILFNHESERRGETFVTKKIISGLARIKKWLLDTLYVGNLDAKRDWGYAPEYVEGMWRMLQTELPEDYVLATGESHSVREFIDEACKNLDIDIQWFGEGIDEIGWYKQKPVIKIDTKYFRPSEIDILQGDASKAKKELGWEPKVKFKELVRIMTYHESQ
jgi:GDPmannose 4,6-dehydratase